MYLKWAGFFYGAIAWWNLTNPSIFGNVFANFEHKNEIHKSLHDFKHII